MYIEKYNLSVSKFYHIERIYQRLRQVLIYPCDIVICEKSYVKRSVTGTFTLGVAKKKGHGEKQYTKWSVRHNNLIRAYIVYLTQAEVRYASRFTCMKRSVEEHKWLTTARLTTEACRRIIYVYYICVCYISPN